MLTQAKPIQQLKHEVIEVLWLESSYAVGYDWAKGYSLEFGVGEWVFRGAEGFEKIESYLE